MSAGQNIPARSRAVQARASDPAASAWVSANAGTGKTTVLVRRVIRLLLAGTPPARILCLTYTKAAAAHMANKVLETLGKWVRLDDAELDRAIREISPLDPTPELRARARRLFAAALETPGGLKVQTIHAFCDRVLHQFPFEAGVPAGFEVLDEIRAADLLTRARNRVLIEAAAEPEGELGRALAHAVTVASDESLEQTLKEAVRERGEIMRLVGRGGDAAVAAALGLQPEETVVAIEDQIISKARLARSEWVSAAATLQALGGNAAARGKALAQAAAARYPETLLDAYLSVFFTGEGEPRDDSGFGSEKVRKSEPALFERILAERDRLTDFRDKRLAAQARARTAALLTLAGAIIHRYEEAKRTHGALDYDDLIHESAAMLENIAATWVLYKLDGGIDHVLIDEAQDTSPEQWKVIEKLTEEFFAGCGAREDRKRTIFAVGDEKQSIFSFQGADPRQFDHMRLAFERRAGDAGASFRRVQLDLSFRSAPGVLDAIDTVFKREAAYAGLANENLPPPPHVAIRAKAPALVEIWPTVKPAKEEEDGLAWDAPLDARSEQSPPVVLAQRIAKAVKFWLGGGIAVGDGKNRRVPRAGDVMVLVRRRGPLFEAILQALKRAKLPVAGADRLTLTDHIAVMDLMALGEALLLETDDLSLACALKSPLFGLSEEELFDLACGRKGTLAAAFAERAKGNSRFAVAHKKFWGWREEARALRPFDFYSRVLGRDRGRERILARIGVEAADALDEFLARALAYEATETPTLAGFLVFLRRAGTEVKRDLEVESEAVRVMTVHGAKGLEAPIIVLADTTSAPEGRHDPKLLALANPDDPTGASKVLVWAHRKESDPAAIRSARDVELESRKEEYRRLLYVALTRAADALVVCGHQGKRQDLPTDCWYGLVRDALEPELAEFDAPYGEGKVWRWRSQVIPAVKTTAKPAKQGIEQPAWLKIDAQPAPQRPQRRRPSDFDPNDEEPRPYARAVRGALDPRRRGKLLHSLLQYLPALAPAQRAEAANRFLATAADGVAEQDREILAAEALSLLDHPDMAMLWEGESLAEVSILGRLEGQPGIEVPGRIDRLVVRPNEVLIVDYKTDADPPKSTAESRKAYEEQLTLYRAVIQKVFPEKAVRAFLVWTATPAIHEILPARLDAASKRLNPT